MSSESVLTIPGRYENIRSVCEFVREGAETAGLDEDLIFRIELACDEAATNIIEHAYGAEETGAITTSYLITADAMTITMRDYGRPFEPATVPPPPSVATETTDVTPDELGTQLQVGGLGLHMIRKLMDEVHFSFDEDNGNTLTMIKRLGKGDK